jgi:hypothetical protein
VAVPEGEVKKSCKALGAAGETGGPWSEASLEQKCEILPENGLEASTIKHLPNKQEAMSSIPNTPKIKNNL